MRLRSVAAVGFLSLAIGVFRGIGAAAQAAPILPRPAHVVVIVEENKSASQIVGNPKAPYINTLIRGGALFIDAHGVTHPSLPNYLALFSGLTNTNKDGCPARGIPKDAPNLASGLLAAHLTFGAYSEALPETGWAGCAAGTYGRKHAPWVHFSNVPASLHRPFSLFPATLERLPTVTFVVPDIEDDMHSGSIARGDAWLRNHLGSFIERATQTDTLFILIWDEGLDPRNTIPLIFLGPMVKPGRYPEFVNHYAVLRTLEDLYGLPHAGRSGEYTPITDCWR